MPTRGPSTRTVLLLSWLFTNAACSTSSSNDEAAGGSSNMNAAGAKGGQSSSTAAVGGAVGSGGVKAASAGSLSGGAATASPGGGGATITSAGSGGAATGGVRTSAAGNTDNPIGGSAAGGMATGGAAGTATGGVATAGATMVSGGTSSVTSGGTATGGAAVAGAALTAAGNGAVAIGGAATGGAATGGAATGGAATGGAATGGAATGGATSGAPVAGAAGAYAGPPSCAGGLKICGKDGNDDCCSSIEVTGGDFLRGRTTETCSDCVEGCPGAVRSYSSSDCYDADEMPEKSVTISSFKLDKYLVTVGRMKKFISAYETWRGAGNPTMWAGAVAGNQDTGFRTGWSLNMTSAGLESGLTSCSSSKVPTYSSDNDAYPVNCINWVQAFAFCIWDGGRLPTEAEWEYAAAGGSENRLYPWGADAPDTTRAHFNQTDPLVPVGYYPAGAGRYGHLDMAGLLWEWTLDVYDPNYYDNPNTCIDCSNWNAAVGTRVLRGGAYVNAVGDGALRATRRLEGTAVPSAASNAWGFRCAR